MTANVGCRGEGEPAKLVKLRRAAVGDNEQKRNIRRHTCGSEEALDALCRHTALQLHWMISVKLEFERPTEDFWRLYHLQQALAEGIIAPAAASVPARDPVATALE